MDLPAPRLRRRHLILYYNGKVFMINHRISISHIIANRRELEGPGAHLFDISKLEDRSMDPTAEQFDKNHGGYFADGLGCRRLCLRNPRPYAGSDSPSPAS